MIQGTTKLTVKVIGFDVPGCTVLPEGLLRRTVNRISLPQPVHEISRSSVWESRIVVGEVQRLWTEEDLFSKLGGSIYAELEVLPSLAERIKAGLRMTPKLRWDFDPCLSDLYIDDFAYQAATPPDNPPLHSAQLLDRIQRFHPVPGDLFALTLPSSHQFREVRDFLQERWASFYPGANLILLLPGQTITQLSDDDLAAQGLQRIEADAPTLLGKEIP